MASPPPDELSAGRVSSMWTGSIVGALVVSVLLAGVAAFLTLQSFRPVGEGTLLAGEASAALRTLAGREGDDLDTAIRLIRNDLGIAAVGILERDGTVSAATSDTLRGSAPVAATQLATVADGRYTAVGARLDVPVRVDGVTAMEAGDGVYLSTGPLGDGRTLLLVYDMTQLLERRAASRTAPEHTESLVVAAGIGVLVAGMIAVARAGARARHARLARETGQLLRRADALQSDNEELARARAATERALALAEETNRIRTEFVLMINHELRTPLTAVVTGARLLETSDRLGTAEQQIVADLIHEGERLDELIGQMLAVARAENRGLTVTPLDLHGADLAARLGSAHRRAALRVAAGVEPAHMMVSTDATTLTQLVASLVDNAFTHGAIQVEVVLAGEPPDDVVHTTGPLRGDDVYVLVVDDGPGIDSAFLPRVFEKFEKRSFSPGTGLGLYLARMMAESIGSPIAVATSPAGTTMAIGIPTVAAREAVA